jgi:antitoxin component YwqK of YwqJK toxin-antitoxin module
MLRLIGIIALVFSFTISYAQTQGEDGIVYNDNGTAYSGEFSTYHANGAADAVYVVEEGFFHGQAIWYDESGEKIETGNYFKGEKDGVWYRWNTEGQLTAEARYIQGDKDGIWTIWDDNGVRRYHMVYHLGEKIDVWKMWDGDSNLLSEATY